MAVRIAPHALSKNTHCPDYSGKSDECLMEMFQDGNALAFHYLIDRHKGLIRLQVRKYFGPAAEFEDVMQDVCLTLWQNRASWKPGMAKFSTWLYRVVSNRCIDLLRRKKEIFTDSSFDHVTSSIQSAEERVSETQLTKQMNALLGQLPEQQKLALRLFYYEDADIEQICKKMSLSDQAVRSLLKRGKQKLRAVMQPESLYA